MILGQDLQNGEVFTAFQKIIQVNYQYKPMLMRLARYSALVQECNMVPIVEPEVLMDGDHSAQDCYIKTSEVIKKCFEELNFTKS